MRLEKGCGRAHRRFTSRGAKKQNTGWRRWCDRRNSMAYKLPLRSEFWLDPERVALFERLCAEGLSYAAIGRRMGVSKNTISGRAWRVGLRRPRPLLPGKILAERYLIPQRITVTRFAAVCGITRQHMDRIVNGRVRITAETAARIAAALGSTTPEYWRDLQNTVDRYDAQHGAASGKIVRGIGRQRRPRAGTMPRAARGHGW